MWQRSSAIFHSSFLVFYCQEEGLLILPQHRSRWHAFHHVDTIVFARDVFCLSDDRQDYSGIAVGFETEKACLCLRPTAKRRDQQCTNTS